MGAFDWVVFDKGQARFCGPERDTEVGSRDVLAVQLTGARAHYGEFRLREVDETNYNVEILSFGYGSEINVGLPAPKARAAFSSTEIEDIRFLISALMLADKEKPFPMHHREEFLGQVSFKEGWIREK